ncbi:MAG: UDP-3-O-acyl-N-acetylglucosamine deacetylase [Deltaproteobacteria bacterium]|nr:UDP-3-O-acyl-N-acetylglucosamine deacetylase [Deltaproteobacteria bacterium]
MSFTWPGRQKVDYRQATVCRKISCTGIGLHTGKKINMTIKPALPDTGIRFVRVDLNSSPMLKAHYDNVVNTMLATSIGYDEYRVSTIEHLMAAFYSLGIDNAVVELDGPEVPAMDGSAAPFVFLLNDAGISLQRAYKKFIVIKRPLLVEDGNRSIAVYPSKELRISYMIDFEHPLLKNQKFDLLFSGQNFVGEISTARTFGFLKDVQTLKKNGLAHGGSLDNAIVIDEFRVINKDGLRFEDEFVRHKILDFIGDLSLAGVHIIGHFVVERSGHSLNVSMLQKLMSTRECWTTVSFKSRHESVRHRIKIPSFGFADPVAA